MTIGGVAVVLVSLIGIGLPLRAGRHERCEHSSFCRKVPLSRVQPRQRRAIAAPWRMSEPADPDLAQLAKRYVELWQDYLTAAAADPETIEALACLVSGMGAAGALWAGGPAAWAAGAAAPPDDGGRAAPPRAAAAAAA